MRTLLLAVLAVFLMLPAFAANAEGPSQSMLTGSSATPLVSRPETTPRSDAAPDERAAQELLEQDLLPGSSVAQNLPQSPLPASGTHQSNYPKIVLYSVSWCPHCKAAKEYFTRNNIPFINRDVELDPDAYRVLTQKYKSSGVPVIVIGDDQEIIKGFDEQKFEKVLEKYKK